MLKGTLQRGLVSVQRVLWLEYEVEGEEKERVRQRLEQHLLSDSTCPHEHASKL